jgi:Zn-dependent protease
MNWSWSVLRCFNTSVKLHWSWLALVFVLSFSFPNLVPIFLVAHFFVLLHEFGHILMAQRLGVITEDITLYPIGGMARVAIPRNAKKEILIVFAGPAVNLVLALVFILVDMIVSDSWIFYPFLYFFYMCNVTLFVFNLLPVFPSDGGRLLRATLFFFMKDDYYKSTLVSVRIGQILAVGMALFGFCYGYLMLCFIALFLFVMSEVELNLVRLSSDVVE